MIDMPLLVTFLIGMVGSIVGRVLASLGMSVITIKGVDAAIGQLKNLVSGSVSALPGDALALFLMAGGGIAINLWFAAISFRLAYWSLTRVTRIVGVQS